MKRRLGGPAIAATQFSQLPQGPSILLHDDPATVQPQRRRVVVPESVMEEALQLAHDGKVSSRNAWEVKILEGMSDSVKSCLQDPNNKASGGGAAASGAVAAATAGSADQYQQFSKAANLVEGGAKVWGHRVENTYLMSTQMVRRLLRNDRGGSEEAAAAEGGDEAAAAAAKTKKKKALERTLAESLAEINMDGSQSHQSAARGAFSAMFRAMTEKFDQGHSQGLLLNNVPVGRCGNFVLDTNDAEDAERLVVAEWREQRLSGGRLSGTGGVLGRNSAAAPPPDVLDTACEPTVFGGSLEGANSILGGGSPSGAAAGEGRPSAGGAQPTVASPGRLSQALLEQTMAHAAQHAVPYFPKEEPTADAVLAASRAPSLFAPGDGDGGGGDDDAMGDWGDDGAGFDDGDGDGAAGGRDGLDSGSVHANGAGGPAVNLGAFARGLVTGAHGLDQLDAAFDGGQQFDPDGGNGWVPLSAVPPVVAGGTKRWAAGPGGSIGALQKLSSMHVAGGRLRPAATQQQLQPPGKRRRTEKTVRFSGELAAGAGGAAQEEAAAERLRLNKTPLTALTPLGVLWLKDPGSLDARGRMYTDPTRAHDIAAAHNLVNKVTFASFASLGTGVLQRSDDAGPCSWRSGDTSATAGDVRSLFQPFCCPYKPHWSVLAKNGRNLQMAIGARGTVAQRGEHDEELGEAVVAEMPFDLNHDGGAGDDFAAYGDEPDHSDDDDGGGPLFNFAVPSELDAAAGGAFTGPSLVDLDDATNDATANSVAGEAVRGEVAPSLVGRGSGALLIQGPETIKVLKMQHATVPTMVDVGRLRRTMWDRTEALLRVAQLQQLQQDGTPIVAAGRGNARPAGVDGGAAPPPSSSYSAVVIDTLPYVPSIAKDGTLSPAFFFFSLLFLANEKNLTLTAIPNDALDDIIVQGVRCVT